MSDDTVIGSIEGSKEPDHDLKLAKLAVDDLGMAERFIARYGHMARKTPDAGWLVYSEEHGYWLSGAQGEGMARRLAHQTARALWDEYRAAKHAAETGKTADGTTQPALWEGIPSRLYDAIQTAANAGATTSMLKQAESYLAAKLKDFDPDPNLICVLNGTLQPTLINEPCFVAYDAGGVAVGYLPAAKVRVGGPDVTIAGWRLKNLGEGMFEVAAPESATRDAVDVDELKAPVGEPAKFERAGLKLAHRLYHLDVKLLPHNPSHRITRQAPVTWDPAADCPKWREHMATVLPREDDRDFFARVMGYGLVGSTQAQCFLFNQGRGADGKSTTLKTIVKVMGNYHHTCDPRAWLENKNRSSADASPDMADMAGDTRLVYCEEPPKGARINEALIKQVSGGLELRARQLNKDLFDFEPRFVMVMSFNDQPRITGGDDGFWRRMRLLRWPHQFSEADQLAAGDMVGKLLAEASGILNWLLWGSAAFRKFGLQPHARMKDDIGAWRSSSDPFGEWLRDRCQIEAGAKALTAELYKDYKDYLEHEGTDGREVMGLRAFQNRLSSTQIQPHKGDGGKRYRLGVKLLPPEDWMTEPRGKPFHREEDER